MKTRFTVLFAGALLLAVAAARGATPAATPSADAFIASLGCSGAPATDVAMSAVPSAPTVEGTPARTNLVMTCGSSCSSNPCKGAVYDTSCVVGTRRGSCISPLGNNCLDGTWQCQCWSGPLP